MRMRVRMREPDAILRELLVLYLVTGFLHDSHGSGARGGTSRINSRRRASFMHMHDGYERERES